MPTFIKVNNISKSFGRKEILKSIDLEIEEGENLALIGPSGSGKTTLLRILDLLEMPTSGKIYFNGVDANASRKRRLEIRRRIGMVFQKPVVFKASVYDNIGYGLKFRGVDKRRIGEKVARALDVVGLSEYADRSAPTLSGGEAQRVALARAIVTEPEVLLLDEPTANLDPVSTEKIEALISRINREYDVMIIMATHDMLQGQRLADRIAVIIGGEITQIGMPEQVFNTPVSEEIARFVGVENIIYGVVESNEGGLTVVDVDISPEKITGISDCKSGEEVRICIRPEEIILSKNMNINMTVRGRGGSARNVIYTNVEKMTGIGPLVRVKMANSLVALITKQSAEEIGLKDGDDVYATFKSTSVHLLRKF